jgi:hypothetical protein
MIRDKIDDGRVGRGNPSCMDMASLLLDKIVSSWWYGIQLVDHGEPVWDVDVLVHMMPAT